MLILKLDKFETVRAAGEKNEDLSRQYEISNIDFPLYGTWFFSVLKRGMRLCAPQAEKTPDLIVENM